MKRLLPLPLPACLLLAITTACSSNGPTAVVETQAGTPTSPLSVSAASVFIVVSASKYPNAAEQALRSRLESLIGPVAYVDDDAVSISAVTGCQLVVVSKTVSSAKVGSKLKTATCGVLFWEDGIQPITLMGTITNNGAAGSDWVSTSRSLYVRSDAPAELRAGLTGTINFYNASLPITHTPSGEAMPAAAIVVAEMNQGSTRKAIYAYDQGQPLADGVPAAGRRVFFGLYHDTFDDLSADGLKLFDAAVRWAAGPPAPPPPPPPPPASGPVFIVVGASKSPNAAEQALRSRLESLIGPVAYVDDDAVSISAVTGCRLVVVSKTVSSDKVGARLKSASCGVLFWEDGIQSLTRMATITSSGSGGTTTSRTLYVRPDAPAELRAGLTGTITFYNASLPITHSPSGEPLPAAAIVVAEINQGSSRKAIYAYDHGQPLANGLPAAGRRVYFGLYHDTFDDLTADGLELFDAAARWAAEAPQTRPRRIVFLVDHARTPNASELSILDRVNGLGIPLVLIDDDEFVPSDTVGCRMVLLSKTVGAELMGDRLKDCPCGIFSWEENQQRLDMLATVNNDGSDSGFWHEPGRMIWVRPDAPASLRAGLSGLVAFYADTAEMSYGKREDVPPSATVVAEFEGPGDHKVIYLYGRGDILADGTPAAGKRLYFGLHRDTFGKLTPEGLRLFDAGVAWTLEE